MSEENKDMREWELQQELADKLLDHGKTTISELLESGEQTAMEGRWEALWKIVEQDVRRRQAYSATVSPKTILTLIAECSRLASRVEELEGELEMIQRLIGKEELPTVLSSRDDLRERVLELDAALQQIADSRMSRDCSYCHLTTRYNGRPRIHNHKDDCPIAIAERVLAGAHAEGKE